MKTRSLSFAASVLLCAALNGQTCPPALSTKPWPTGKVVHVNIGNLPANLQGPAATAIQRMSERANPGNITFVNGGGNDFIFFTAPSVEHNGSQTVAGMNVQARDSNGYILAAQGYLAPTFTLNNGDLALDPAKPGFDEAVIGLVMHELTHSLGVNDTSVPDPNNTATCGGQTQGSSVMNAYCGPNNQGYPGGQAGSMASHLSECDITAMAAWFRGTPGTDDIYTNEGEDGPCYENWDVTIWENWDGSQWVFDRITWDQYNYTHCGPPPI